MPNTDSMWTQDSAFGDMEIFVGASEIRDANAGSVLTLAGPGLLSLNLGASANGSYYVHIGALLKRFGMYATPALVQEQFGTAASLPGPTAVPNTSGPEGIMGLPPFPASQLATLTGAKAGPVSKGVQINSVDAIYKVSTAALSSISMYVSNIILPAGTVTFLYPNSGALLPLAIQANPYRINIPMTIQQFLNLSGSQANIQMTVQTAGTGTFALYGFVVKCSYNFN